MPAGGAGQVENTFGLLTPNLSQVLNANQPPNGRA
jgi:hypothetical protein